MSPRDPTPCYATEASHAARFDEAYGIREPETGVPLYRLRSTLIRISSALASLNVSTDNGIVRELGALIVEARELITQLETEDEEQECQCNRG